MTPLPSFCYSTATESQTHKEKPQWWYTCGFSCFVEKCSAAESGGAVRSDLFGGQWPRNPMHARHTYTTRVVPLTENVQRCPTWIQTPGTTKSRRYGLKWPKIGGGSAMSNMSNLDPHPSQIRHNSTLLFLSRFRYPPTYLGHVGHNVPGCRKTGLGTPSRLNLCPRWVGHRNDALDIYKGGVA